MSMKSITMMPPMSLRRSCLAVSLAASRLVFRIVFSWLLRPTYLRVLTSIATRASVWSMTSAPPDLSGTSLLVICAISDSMPYWSKIGVLPR